MLPLLLPLLLVSLLSICLTVLPAQGQEDNDDDDLPVSNNEKKPRTLPAKKNPYLGPNYHNPTSGSNWLKNRDNWLVAKANIDKFFSLTDQAIADLFEYKIDSLPNHVIDLDEHTSLIVQRSLSRPVTVFMFGPGNLALLRYRVQYAQSIMGANLEHQPDAIWTGAKRKSETEYWTIIKANLDKLIGMKQDKVKALLGPPRCYSKERSVLTYRIGDAGLDFWFKEDKVNKFRFESDKYIPGT
jgi:hypothetical protein